MSRPPEMTSMFAVILASSPGFAIGRAADHLAEFDAAGALADRGERVHASNIVS